jgi:uncharacterized protein (TIGR02594 family)
MICFFKKKKPVKVSLAKNAPRWYKKAVKELGVAEIKGRNHNPKILVYHQATSLKAKSDETSWCSSFINWLFEECGMSGTDKANARSWLDWGKPLNAPKKGCVVIFWRVSLKGWQGHVGLYVKEDSKNIYVLGGNQSNKVSIAPYPKNRLLGYRWPVL